MHVVFNRYKKFPQSGCASWQVSLDKLVFWGLGYTIVATSQNSSLENRCVASYPQGPLPTPQWVWVLTVSHPLPLCIFSPLPVAVLRQQWDILGWSQRPARRRSHRATCLWCGMSSAVTLRPFGNGRVKTSLKKGKVLKSINAPQALISNPTKYIYSTHAARVFFWLKWTSGRIIASGFLGQLGESLLSTQADMLTQSDKLHFLNPS